MMLTRFTGKEPAAAALYKELTPIIFPELAAEKVSDADAYAYADAADDNDVNDADANL